MISGIDVAHHECGELVFRARGACVDEHQPARLEHAFELFQHRQIVWQMLDHAHDNEVARAYDRGERFTQRVELFNWWGEQLTAAQHGAKIIALSGEAYGAA